MEEKGGSKHCSVLLCLLKLEEEVKVHTRTCDFDFFPQNNQLGGNCLLFLLSDLYEFEFLNRVKNIILRAKTE